MAAGGTELSLIPDGWRANYFELLTRCWLAAGQTEQAEQAAAHAASTARTVCLPLADAMAHRAAAAVALATGDPSVAAERALASVASAEEIDARVDAAVARTLAGRALAAAGTPRGPWRSWSAPPGSWTPAERPGTGARPSTSCASWAGTPTDAGRDPTGAGVETLTARETEIALLVAQRRTNPEVASELFLSVKTIETHMRNIFRKLDVTSRLDVALAIERADRLNEDAVGTRS